MIDEDDVTEVMVTVSFPLAVTRDDAAGVRELATQLRDRLFEDPEVLRSVVADALHDDYDVTVKPFDEP